MTAQATEYRGADPSNGLPLPHRYSAIAALSLGTIVTSFDGGSVAIALPTLARELGVEPSVAVMVVTIYQLVLIMAVLPFSALGDRIGHRSMYRGGIAVFVAATMICVFATSLPFLIVVRSIQALGAAATFSVSAALIRAIYPQARLGSGMAFNTIVAATSASIAPTLGGLILSVANWHWLFVVTVPIGIISLVVGGRALPTTLKRPHPYDMAAAVMCAAMFGFGVVGVESALHGGPAIISAGLLTAAVVLGVVFVRHENRQNDPILPIDLLRKGDIALASIGALLAHTAATGFLLTLPFGLQRSYGYSPAQTGLLMATWPIVMMVVAPAAGMLSDRIAPPRLGVLGMVIGTAGLLAFATLAASPGSLDIIWRVGLASLGFGLYHSPTARLIIGSVPRNRTAAAGALTQTLRLAGQVIGSTTAAIMLSLGNDVGTTAAVLGASQALIAGLCSFAILVSLRPVAART